MLLSDSRAVISELENDEVDNYMYELVGGINETMLLTVKVVEFVGRVEFRIRTCEDSKGCVVKSPKEVIEGEKWK